MINRDALVEFLNSELQVKGYPDSSMNGLQFEGNSEITKVAVAVDSGLAVIKKSIAAGAQFLIVHHGLFWEKAFCITGANKEIFELLIKHNLSLYAVHLPLDSHEKYGNNFCLARLLGLEQIRPAINYMGKPVGCVATNSKNHSLKDFVNQLEKLPGARNPFLTFDFGPKIPAKICIVTGSGSDALYKAAEEGFDTLITGEPRQFAYHYSLENKLNAIFAGHYATETIGVCELGKLLSQRYGLSFEFIDLPTGV